MKVGDIVTDGAMIFEIAEVSTDGFILPVDGSMCQLGNDNKLYTVLTRYGWIDWQGFKSVDGEILRLYNTHYTI